MRDVSALLREMREAARNAILDDETLLERLAFRLDGLRTPPRSETTSALDSPPDAVSVATSATFARRPIITLSLQQASAVLAIEREAVVRLIDGGHLQGISISGALHIPEWQFVASARDGLMPGLTRILQAAEGRLTWEDLAYFMVTPQTSLVGVGQVNIVEWLHEGGPVEPVLAIVREGKQE